MFRIQATYTSLRQAKPIFGQEIMAAKMGLGSTVLGGWLGISLLECLGGQDYFNLGINIDRDNRPNHNHNSDRFETVEALLRNISGGYRERVTVPV